MLGMEIFCENSEQLLAVKYFRKKASFIIDIWEDPRYAYGLLNQISL